MIPQPTAARRLAKILADLTALLDEEIDWPATPLLGACAAKQNLRIAVSAWPPACISCVTPLDLEDRPRKTAIHCSPACRQAAQRQRTRAALAARAAQR